MGRKIFFNFAVQGQPIFFPLLEVVERSTEAMKLIETIITVTVLINRQTRQLTHADGDIIVAAPPARLVVHLEDFFKLFFYDLQNFFCAEIAGWLLI